MFIVQSKDKIHQSFKDLSQICLILTGNPGNPQQLYLLPPPDRALHPYKRIVDVLLYQTVCIFNLIFNRSNYNEFGMSLYLYIFLLYFYFYPPSIKSNQFILHLLPEELFTGRNEQLEKPVFLILYQTNDKFFVYFFFKPVFLTQLIGRIFVFIYCRTKIFT